MKFLNRIAGTRFSATNPRLMNSPLSLKMNSLKLMRICRKIYGRSIKIMTTGNMNDLVGPWRFCTGLQETAQWTLGFRLSFVTRKLPIASISFIFPAKFVNKWFKYFKFDHSVLHLSSHPNIPEFVTGYLSIERGLGGQLPGISSTAGLTRRTNILI